MPSKTFPVGMDEEFRARHEKLAKDAGLSFAEYIRRCMEVVDRMKFSLDAEAAMPDGVLSATGNAVHQARASDLRVFRGPDLKPSEKKSK